MNETILVIEDDPNIQKVLNYNLSQEGYRVSSSRDGLEGLRMAKTDKPDLLLLDLMLPGMDGLEICRQLKADDFTSTFPIIIISVKGKESDIVVGLELGADDYVTKPFNVSELIARIRAVRRRCKTGPHAPCVGQIRHGALVIDVDKHKVLIDDCPVDFTTTQFRMLVALAEWPGRILTYEMLTSSAFDDDVYVQDHTVHTHISNIRTKLGQYENYIQTKRKVGYNFIEL